jgi:hypothetical protein
MSDMIKNRPDRSKRLSIRLTSEEHRRLLDEAERVYLPLSAYIRHRLFGREAEMPNWRRVRKRRGR